MRRRALVVLTCALLVLPLSPAPVSSASPPVGGPDGSPQVYRWADSASSHPRSPGGSYASITSFPGASLVPGPCRVGSLDCPSGGLGDEDYSSTCVPFTSMRTFTFYGASYRCAWVHSNGYLALGTGTPAALSPGHLPIAGATHALIAGFWTDLKPCGGRVAYQAGTAEFVVEYKDVQVTSETGLCTGAPLNFQVRIRYDSSTPGDVVVKLKDVDTTRAVERVGAVQGAGTGVGVPALSSTEVSAVIGIASPGGSFGLTYASGAQSHRDSAVRFFPNTAPTLPWGVFLTEDTPQAWPFAVDADGDAVQVVSFSQPTYKPPSKPPIQVGTVTTSGGDFVLTPAPDWFGGGQFTATLEDQYGFRATSTAPLYFSQVNDPASLREANVTVSKSAGAVDIPGLIDPGPYESDYVGATIQVDNPSLFAVAPRFVGYDLRFTTAHLAGKATLRVTLTEYASSAPSFPPIQADFVVEATNAAPVAQDLAIQTLEDTPRTFAVQAGDPDGDGLTIVATSNPGLGTVAPSGASLTYTPHPDAYGLDSFTYTVQDPEGAQATATVSMTITPVNDAPTLVAGPDVRVRRNADPVAMPWASGISVGPANEGPSCGCPAPQQLTISAAHDNAGLFSDPPALRPDGTLTFTPAPDALGTALVTVRVQDDGGTANGGADTVAAQFRIEVFKGKA